jgi:TIR domain
MSQTSSAPDVSTVGAAAASAAFLSYSHEDSSFVLELVSQLKSAGGDVWLDKMDILPGQPWDLSIQDALASCSRLLVVLSPASVASRNVLDEVSYALDNHKVVIPVLYRDCEVPFRLRRLQYVDFRAEYALGFQGLLRTLQAPSSDGAISLRPDTALNHHSVDSGESGGPVSQQRPEGRGTGLVTALPGSPAAKASVGAFLVLLVASLLWFGSRALRHPSQPNSGGQTNISTGGTSQPVGPATVTPSPVVPASKPKITHLNTAESANRVNSAEYQQLRQRLVETQEQAKAAAGFWAPIKADLGRSNQSLRPEIQTALSTLNRSTGDAGRLLQAGDLTGTRLSLDSADKQLGILQRYQNE